MDNRYYNYNCPPLMNDGRFINSYIRSSTFDQYIKNINNINDANEYRHYLQNNGYEIINNIKAYLRQNNTCSVEGKCLPMSGPTTPIISKDNVKEQWYVEMLDEDTSQLDFMMHHNETDNTNTPSQLQPTIYHNNTEEPCTTCIKN